MPCYDDRPSDEYLEGYHKGVDNVEKRYDNLIAREKALSFQCDTWAKDRKERDMMGNILCNIGKALERGELKEITTDFIEWWVKHKIRDAEKRDKE